MDFQETGIDNNWKQLWCSLLIPLLHLIRLCKCLFIFSYVSTMQVNGDLNRSINSFVSFSYDQFNTFQWWWNCDLIVPFFYKNVPFFFVLIFTFHHCDAFGQFRLTSNKITRSASFRIYRSRHLVEIFTNAHCAASSSRNRINHWLCSCRTSLNMDSKMAFKYLYHVVALQHLSAKIKC